MALHHFSDHATSSNIRTSPLSSLLLSVTFDQLPPKQDLFYRRYLARSIFFMSLSVLSFTLAASTATSLFS